MTTFAPRCLLHIRRDVVSALFSLFQTCLVNTLFIFPQQSICQSGHISFLSPLQDDDSTLTLITQFPPLIEQFYYKIDRLLPIYTAHSCIFIRQPAAVLCSHSCYSGLLHTRWKQSLKHLSPQTDCVWVIFLVHLRLLSQERLQLHVQLLYV